MRELARIGGVEHVSPPPVHRQTAPDSFAFVVVVQMLQRSLLLASLLMMSLVASGKLPRVDTVQTAMM